MRTTTSSGTLFSIVILLAGWFATSPVHLAAQGTTSYGNQTMTVGAGAALTTSGTGTIGGTMTPSSLGTTSPQPASPICVTGNATFPTIASCITFLNTLGVTNTGVIYSMVPEDFTSQPFAAGPWEGKVYLNNSLIDATTCGQTVNSGGTFNCYTAEVPLIIPSKLLLLGTGTANGSGVASGTVLTFGKSFPQALGPPTFASPPACSGTGTLGQVYIQVALVRNASQGTNTPLTPLYGLPSSEISLNCGGTQNVVFTLNNDARAQNGAFGPYDLAVFTSPFQGLENENGTGVNCGTQGAGNIDTSNGACNFPPTGNSAITVTAVQQPGASGSGMPAPLVDLSNPIMVVENGQPNGNAFDAQYRDGTLDGSPNNRTGLTEINEPGCAYLDVQGQEQSGLENIALSGAFTSCGIYAASGNSHYSAINFGSADGPNEGTITGSPFSLTGVTIVSTQATYAGPSISLGPCGSNACVGLTINVTGFTNGGNNVSNAVVIGSSTTTLVVTTSTQVAASLQSGTATVLPNSFIGFICDARGPRGCAREIRDMTMAARCSSCASSPITPEQLLITGPFSTQSSGPSISGFHGEVGNGPDVVVQIDQGASATLTGVGGFSTGTTSATVHITNTNYPAFVGSVFLNNINCASKPACVKDDRYNATYWTGTGQLSTYTDNLFLAGGFVQSGTAHFPGNLAQQIGGNAAAVSTTTCCTIWKTYNLPVTSMAENYSLTCDLPYQTAGTTQPKLILGLQAPQGSTNLFGEAQIYTSNSAATATEGSASNATTAWLTVLQGGASSAATTTFDSILNATVEVPGSAGSVNTSTTNVSWESGAQFNTAWTGNIVIGVPGIAYPISAVTSTTSIMLSLPGAGSQTGVPYYFQQTLNVGTAINGGTGSPSATIQRGAQCVLD